MPQPAALILSPKFNEALLYSGELHGRQRRKGSGIPFMAHLLGVASIVLEDGGDEEEGIAALLHDAVEDHPRGGATEREILARFGPRVHRIVMGCTEPDPHALERGHRGPWEERKLRYIAQLRNSTDPDTLRVAAADKLYNARSIINDMRLVGEDVWKRFSVPKEKTLWYYRTVTDALCQATPIKNSRLARELAGIVQAMEQGVQPLR
jgi:GTP pyrophosphokinase